MEPSVTYVPVEQLEPRLQHLVALVGQGYEIIITRGSAPLVRLTRIEPEAPQRATRELGAGRGQVLSIADDFDAPLELLPSA